MFDTSKLKTFEDAVLAIAEMNFPDDNADRQAIVEWIWDNCDRGNDDVVMAVYFYTDTDSELQDIAWEQLNELLPGKE